MIMIRIFLIPAALVAFAVTAAAQTLANYSAAMASNDPKERVAAFYAFRSNFDVRQTPEAARAALDLLERENGITQAYIRAGKIPSDVLGEGYGRYQGDVAELVLYSEADTRDPEALDALINTGINPRTTVGKSLALQGPAIAKQLSAHLNDPNSDVRLLVTGVLAQILGSARSGGNPIDAGLEGRIRSAVLAALADPNQGVRLEAIRDLGVIGDPAFIPLLARIEAGAATNELAERLTAEMATATIRKSMSMKGGG